MTNFEQFLHFDISTPLFSLKFTFVCSIFEIMQNLSIIVLCSCINHVLVEL